MGLAGILPDEIPRFRETALSGAGTSRVDDDGGGGMARLFMTARRIRFSRGDEGVAAVYSGGGEGEGEGEGRG